MPESQIPEAVCFSGRIFSADEVQLIQQLTADFAALSLTELSRTVCELLQWKRPNGGLKNHECRLFLERLAGRGLVRLPAMRPGGPKGPRVVRLGDRGEPETELSGTASQFEPLELQLIQRGQEGDSRLWTELIERYHYLGYRVPVGANLRYLVRSARYPGRVLACLLWTSPAWKMAVRDRWIGWSDVERSRNLQLIVNNGRFLILPDVRVAGLASKILSRCSRQLPADWERHYGYRPLLLETLVDCHRFRGTCYKAANWILLGRTQGRGRMDRDNVAQGRAVKNVYVYPLYRNVQQRLRTAVAPSFSRSVEEQW
jgi:Druantia protein DruA